MATDGTSAEIGRVEPAEVTAFWVNEVGPERWYRADDALDAAIRHRFLPRWQEALAGGLQGWKCGPDWSLAYVILTDQFPRNMFRDDARAFATDALARAAALRAIKQGWDLRIAAPQRQFFYLPLMHSEVLEDQERALRLILTRMPSDGGSNLLHARAHRDVIRRFGRFPHRNAALGRAVAAAEAAYLDAGGYGAVVRALQDTQAA